MSRRSTISTCAAPRARRMSRNQAAIALATLGLFTAGARAQYNIADLGANYGAPLSLEGNGAVLLLPDLTTGQTIGFNTPVGDRGTGTYPVPTLLNQLANAPGGPPVNPATFTSAMVLDGGTSQAPDSDSLRIGGTFTAADGSSHLFEFFNPILDGNSPPTTEFDTRFQDYGSVPGHANDILTVTSIDMFNNIVGYTTDSFGNKTPFIKRIGDNPLQVLSGTPIQTPTGVLNGRVVGNALINTPNGPISHGYYNNADVGTLGGTGTHISGIGGDFSIAGTSQAANGFNHAFFSSPINFGTAQEQAGPLVDLGTLGGNNSFADAIAPESIGAPGIVGAAQTASGAFHAFIDFGGSGPMVDLNNLLSPADQANWTLIEATVIDNSGDIGGIGLLNGVAHSFYMTTETLAQKPLPPVTVQTDAPTKVIQSSPGAQVIVPFNTTVTLNGSAPQPLFAPYSLTSSGTPAPRFIFGNGHASPDGVLSTIGQADTFNYELDLTGVIASNYTGAVTFSAPGTGLSNVDASVNIQVLDPANFFAAGQLDAQGNQTGVQIFATPSGSRAIPDGEIAGTPNISPGWSQVGTAFSDGAKISANGSLSTTFMFNDPHAANGIHYGFVFFSAQNDRTILGASAIAPQGFVAELSFDVENPALPKGSPYANLSNTSPFRDQTTATLLDGSVGDNPSAATPGNGMPTINIIGNGGANPNLDSDIITLSGTNGDIVVLQLSFVNLTNDMNAADFALMYDPTNGSFAVGDATELAVAANTGPSIPTPFYRAYNPATDFVLGYYGVDLVNNVAWAVIDHNSQFAVETLPVSVPEPASILSLGSLASLSLLRRRRK